MKINIILLHSITFPSFLTLVDKTVFFALPFAFVSLHRTDTVSSVTQFKTKGRVFGVGRGLHSNYLCCVVKPRVDTWRKCKLKRKLDLKFACKTSSV